MSRRRAPAASTPARHKGLTLVELLVTLALSLVVMAAVGQAFVATSAAARIAEAQSRMSDDGLAALNILAHHLRLAGDNPARPNRAPSSRRNPLPTGPVIRGCDERFSAVKTPMDLTTLDCPHGATTSATTAAIVVRYEADLDNTLPSDPPVDPTDCVGTRVPAVSTMVTLDDGTDAPVRMHVVDNLFYVGTSASIKMPSLYCRGNQGNPKPLVENIEALQFEYGVDSAAAGSTTRIGGYLRAHALETSSSGALASAPTVLERWNLVRSVRVCVLVRSADEVMPADQPQQFTDCNGELTTAPDRRLRRAFSTTVVLRNMLR